MIATARPLKTTDSVNLGTLVGALATDWDDLALLTAPPLTLTPTALEQPLVARLATVLDGTLRILWYPLSRVSR